MARVVGESKANPKYYREAARYIQLRSSVTPIRIGVTNIGDELLTGVCLVFDKIPMENIVLRSDLPGAPSKFDSVLAVKLKGFKPVDYTTAIGTVELREDREQIIMAIEFNKLRRGEPVYSNTIYIGSPMSGRADFTGNIFSEQHAPQQFSLHLVFDVVHQIHTVETVLKLIQDAEQSIAEAANESN